ncbi:flagellar hook capping FlgD N-terminal domain-containing protein [Desulfothermobacter acidiphilus]|uniref:flagellar hook capping FlgD N-terminal domain-containing protein n=1 Tax=Desulfothermobacter acidiphilus TaxID=1938353 RepID=UPI003F8BD8AE
MDVNAIMATPAGAAGVAGASFSRWDKDTFLKILVAQLSHPDPFSPPKPENIIAEMSSLALLEQMTRLTSSLDSFSKWMELGQGAGLVGKKVAVEASGSAVTGAVEKVRLEDGKIRLVIEGQEYPLSAVKEVW